MKKMVEKNLHESLAGESQAHIKYMAFAKRADKDEKPNVARLFRAASFAEQVHASEQLRILGGIGSTTENLEGAASGETFELEEMYPAHRAVAELQEAGPEVLQTIKHAINAEKSHQGLYNKALEAVKGGGDLKVEGDQLWVCGMCGYTATGEMPDRCPSCNSPKKCFVTF